MGKLHVVTDIDLNQGYFGENSAGVRPAMYISLKS